MAARWLMLTLVVLLLSASGSAQAPGFKPVGTIRQIMLGILTPTSDVIFAVPNKPPQDDAAWQSVQNSSLMLAEVGNLLMIPGRAQDKGDWMKFANQLNEAGAEAFKAANAKNAAALEDIGNKIDGVCEGCHAKYLPKPPE
jgi:hypothetical protein